MLDEQERHHYEALVMLHRQQLQRIELKTVPVGPLPIPTHLQHKLEATIAAPEQSF